MNRRNAERWTATSDEKDESVILDHAADKAADAKYGLKGGDDATECLRHRSRWRLEWHGSRVTSVNGDAKDWFRRRCREGIGFASRIAMVHKLMLMLPKFPPAIQGLRSNGRGM